MSFKKHHVVLFIIGAVLFVLLITFSSSGDLPLAVPKTLPAITPLTTQPRVALVLGSGGARGYASVGVVKVLQQAGIPIDLVVGASSGSIIGAIYADSGNAVRLEKIMLDSGYADFIDVSLLHPYTGLISGINEQNFLLRQMMARDFRDLKIKLAVVATDLSTGEAVILDSGPIAPAVVASTALPGLVKPVKLYGYELIDGGVAEPVPVSIAKKYRPKIIIAVDVSPELAEVWPNSAYGIYSRAYQIMWRRLVELTLKDADVVIHPAVGQTGTFAISQRMTIEQAGEAAAQKMLPEIRRVLQQKDVRF